MQQNITAKERDMEDILTDNIQNEKTLREILNIEERLQVGTLLFFCMYKAHLIMFGVICYFLWMS